MACNFTIDTHSSGSELVSSVRNKVESQGGSFNGDAAAGNFDVPLLGSRISGSYQIFGKQMTVDISDKPFFITCNQIRTFIEGNLG
jgi:hypothetical protein